jgi:hypothetical protein
MNIGNLGVNTSSSSHNIDMDRAPGSNIRTACDSCRARKTKVIVVLSIPRHLHSTLASLPLLIGGPLLLSARQRNQPVLTASKRIGSVPILNLLSGANREHLVSFVAEWHYNKY